MDTQLQAVKIVTHGTSNKVMRRAAACLRDPTPRRRAVPSLSGKGLFGPMWGLGHRARCGTLPYVYWSVPQGFLTALLLVFLRLVLCMGL